MIQAGAYNSAFRFHRYSGLGGASLGAIIYKDVDGIALVNTILQGEWYGNHKNRLVN